jgi:hypothetical protein
MQNILVDEKPAELRFRQSPDTFLSAGYGSGYASLRYSAHQTAAPKSLAIVD